MRACWLPWVVLGIVGCQGQPGSVLEEPSMAFSVDSLDLGNAVVGTVGLVNTGTATLEDIRVEIGDVVGSAASSVTVSIAPPLIERLEPAASATLSIVIDYGQPVIDGDVSARLFARSEATDPVEATLRLDFTVFESTLTLIRPPGLVKEGDVVQFDVVQNTIDGPVEPSGVLWSVEPPLSGFVDGAGKFVAYREGLVSVVATAGAIAGQSSFSIAKRGLIPGSMPVVAFRAKDDTWATDLWVHGDVVLQGQWGEEAPTDLLVWDIQDRSNPVAQTPVPIDTPRINDVKISEDGAIAVVTHEDSVGGGAITILDMANPLAPNPIKTFTNVGLATGVHNVWIDGDYVYAITDGETTETGGMWILDISTPTDPVSVGRFYTGSGSAHDVYIRDGFAFLSHWETGLVILDVGNGLFGGSPQSRQHVVTVPFDSPYLAHNAWYWPARKLLFVGDEYNIPGGGYIRVLDVSDLTNPVEIATYRVIGDAPHNLWIDEEKEIGYFAMYSLGLHAVDLSGELFGELDRQKRLISSSLYGGNGSCFAVGTCTWGPHPHDGYIYVSDLNLGLYVLEPNF